MRRPVCAALAVLALLLAWPAFAQDADEDTGTDAQQAEEPDQDQDTDQDQGADDPNRTGAYVGLAGTWGHQEFQDTNNINVDDSVGFNARAGYRALSWLSAEVQGEWLAGFNVDFGADSGEIEMHLIGGNLRLNLPTGLIQPYALFGGGYMNANLTGVSGGQGQDGDGAFARLGGGMEFYPWPFLALDFGLTYVLPTGDVDKLDFLSITWGALYRF